MDQLKDPYYYDNVGGSADSVSDGAELRFNTATDSRIIHFSLSEAETLRNTIRACVSRPYTTASVVLRPDLEVDFALSVKTADKGYGNEDYWRVRFIFNGHDATDLEMDEPKSWLLLMAEKLVTQARENRDRQQAGFVAALRKALEG